MWFSAPLPHSVEVPLTTCVVQWRQRLPYRSKDLPWTPHLKAADRISCHWFGSKLGFPSFSNQRFLSYQSCSTLINFRLSAVPYCAHCVTEEEKGKWVSLKFLTLISLWFSTRQFDFNCLKPFTQSIDGRLARSSWSCDVRWFKTVLLYAVQYSAAEDPLLSTS